MNWKKSVTRILGSSSMTFNAHTQLNWHTHSHCYPSVCFTLCVFSDWRVSGSLAHVPPTCSDLSPDNLTPFSPPEETNLPVPAALLLDSCSLLFSIVLCYSLWFFLFFALLPFSIVVLFSIAQLFFNVLLLLTALLDFSIAFYCSKLIFSNLCYSVLLFTVQCYL